MEDTRAVKRCIGCGREREARLMRPFAVDKFARPTSWVCSACAGPERLHGAAALAWTTVARAERLAVAGAGWSADHVMRRALDLLEVARAEGRA